MPAQSVELLQKPHRWQELVQALADQAILQLQKQALYEYSWPEYAGTFDWYLAVVIAGAIHHDMNGESITALKDTVFIANPSQFRTTRIAAIKAMHDNGIGDYRRLL